MSKLLIAFASHAGYTTEIAETLGEELRAAGHDVDIVNLRSREGKKHPGPGGYDGLILAAGVRLGQWHKAARRFLDAHGEGIRGTTLGLVVCCLTAISDPEKARKEYLDDFAEARGLSPRLALAVPGVADGRAAGGTLGFFARGVMRMAIKEMNAKEGTDLDPTGLNDRRDWDAIRAFAREFAELVPAG